MENHLVRVRVRVRARARVRVRVRVRCMKNHRFAQLSPQQRHSPHESRAWLGLG
jgi:hypothetical protein